MRAKGRLLSVLLLTSFFAPSAVLSDEILSGIVGLSCQAILCLSTGSPPGECNPALNYFYNIKAKKWSKTIKKRKNFLNLCPASKEPGMPNYVNLLANGNYLYRCDSESLITNLNRECKGGGGFGHSMFTNCLKDIPSYCKSLASHEYTDITLPIFKKSCGYTEYGYQCKKVWYLPSS